MMPGTGETTTFATAAFCRVWAECYGLEWEPLPGSTDLGLLLRRSRRLGLKRYELGPRGLYWGPSGADDHTAAELAEHARAACRGGRSTAFTWNFRYDWRALLDQVVAALDARCLVSEAHAHVLSLEGRTLDAILAEHVKPVTRRQVGYARERGVEVRPLATEAELERYRALALSFARARGVAPYPAALVPRLVAEAGAGLYGAFHAGELLGAAFVFRDAREWFYWHGVRDPERDRHHAMDALLAHAVGEACGAGARAFNMGASSGIESVEFFKERWGAAPRPVWSLDWKSAAWGPMLQVRRRLAGIAEG